MVKLEGNNMRINLERGIDESYDIIFGHDIFPQIGEELKKKGYSRHAIITDSNVGKLYSDDLKKALRDSNLDVDVFTFKAGERSKNGKTHNDLINELSKHKYDRNSVILGLGGGVVTDVTGYAAATYLRGINFWPIPTSLLAQVDSSIGGKTGINTKYGKNLEGAFKQPDGVIIDTSTLKTLAEREFVSGMAEVIKHAAIKDSPFFEYLENNYGLLLEKNPDALLYNAMVNCRIKGDVVERDPKEKGERRILNFGHTLGHALEKLSGYTIPHGEGVSIGMTFAGEISASLGYLNRSELRRLKKLLEDVGLPTHIPDKVPTMIPFNKRRIYDDEIIEATSVDKKGEGGKARYVLSTGIGIVHDFNGAYVTPVEKDVVMNALRVTRYR